MSDPIVGLFGRDPDFIFYTKTAAGTNTIISVPNDNSIEEIVKENNIYSSPFCRTSETRVYKFLL